MKVEPRSRARRRRWSEAKVVRRRSGATSAWLRLPLGKPRKTDDPKGVSGFLLL